MGNLVGRSICGGCTARIGMDSRDQDGSTGAGGCFDRAGSGQQIPHCHHHRCLPDRAWRCRMDCRVKLRSGAFTRVIAGAAGYERQASQPFSVSARRRQIGCSRRVRFPKQPCNQSAGSGRADETSIIRAKAAPPVLATKQDARPPGLTAVERTKVAARPVPVPETRPTTIEGWTVRDVNNGTVTLQGPNGVWKATRGSTVPGVGNITSIVRWGDRWIVATSKGLISTR